jgi:acetoin utilization deacetylase AcuC-like enzyme
MPTAFFSHADCRDHDTGAGHPECAARLDAIDDCLRASGLEQALCRRDAPLVDWETVALAHDAGYVAYLQALLLQVAATGEPRVVDPDTMASVGTCNAVRRAAGAAVAATDAVLDGEVSNAFCAVRPPGHHATRDAAMGFCFVNNLAVAARHALVVRGLQRVAIIDFDVHHGNGTEDIVAGDERIVMVGFFQHPLYPYRGDQPQAANLVNLPVPAHTRGAAIRALIEAQWLPRLEAFQPQMLFISAGFDAHRDDGLAQLGLVEADYAWITRQLMAVARRHARGRIVSCLEGGYHLGALGRSVVAHLRELAADGLQDGNATQGSP